jgi:hypothetical protein
MDRSLQTTVRNNDWNDFSGKIDFLFEPERIANSPEKWFMSNNSLKRDEKLERTPITVLEYETVKFLNDFEMVSL